MTTQIKAMNMDSRELRTIVDNGSADLGLRLDGEFACYLSNLMGNLDVYLHVMTTGPMDMVAYADGRSGNLDIYLASSSTASYPRPSPSAKAPVACAPCPRRA